MWATHWGACRSLRPSWRLTINIQAAGRKYSARLNGSTCYPANQVQHLGNELPRHSVARLMPSIFITLELARHLLDHLHLYRRRAHAHEQYQMFTLHQPVPCLFAAVIPQRFLRCTPSAQDQGILLQVRLTSPKAANQASQSVRGNTPSHLPLSSLSRDWALRSLLGALPPDSCKWGCQSRSSQSSELVVSSRGHKLGNLTYRSHQPFWIPSDQYHLHCLACAICIAIIWGLIRLHDLSMILFACLTPQVQLHQGDRISQNHAGNRPVPTPSHFGCTQGHQVTPNVDDLLRPDQVRLLQALATRRQQQQQQQQQQNEDEDEEGKEQEGEEEEEEDKQTCDKTICGKMIVSCGMKRTSHRALHLRARAEHMNNTNAHTTIHHPYGIAGVRSSTQYIYIYVYLTMAHGFLSLTSLISQLKKSTSADGFHGQRYATWKRILIIP